MKKRYGWLDVMKLLGVYFVYVVHCADCGSIGLFFSGILQGVMFFASGFSASSRENVPPGAYAKERFLRLMVPYFSFGMLSIALRVLLYKMPMGLIIQDVRHLLYGMRNQVPSVALWFLPCLLMMGIYYHVLRRMIKNRALLLAVCFAVSAAVKLIYEAPLLPWGMDQAARFLIYYALGDWAHAVYLTWEEKKQKVCPKLWQKLLFAAFLAVNFYVLYAQFFFDWGYFPSFFGRIGLSYPEISLIQFLYQCNGIICVWAISVFLSALPGLCRAGRGTIIFCCAEQPVKILLPVALRVLGLNVYETGPEYALMYAALAMVAAYWFAVRPVEQYFPRLLGKFGQKKQPEQA